MYKHLSSPIKLGTLSLKNRVVLAAMTRMRTDPKTGIPNDLMVDYYSQRAGAGLILTECAAVSQRGEGFPGAGNFYNKQQADGWKRVVAAVKAKGAHIFAQLFHAGRNSHPLMNGNQQLWAPSAIAIRGRIPGQKIEYVAPKEATLENIQQIKDQFLNSFKLAKEAGFDGVQLHGANGYIIDEFIRSYSNRRTDSYGQSLENRCRLALQIVDLAFTVFPKEVVSIKLSPVGRYGDMFDENPKETYSYLLKELDKKKIGSIEAMRPQGEMPLYGHKPPLEQLPNSMDFFRQHYKGVLIGNNNYDAKTAEKDISEGRADMVSFARLHIVNPDLYNRIINDWPIENKQDLKTWFGGNEKGYSDRPTYSKK